MSLLTSFKIILIYSFPLVTLIGLITNSISFVIFSRKRFRNTIFSTYFRFYILFQTLNLILPINKMLELNMNIYVSQSSNFMCKLRFFYPNVNFSNAGWLLAIISIDRFICISYPTKFLFRKSQLFQIFTSCFIILCNICYYSSSWFYYLKETTANLTNHTDILSSYTCVSPNFETDLLELIQQMIAPFCIMIIFTLLTIKNVYRSRKIINQSNGSSSKTMVNDRKFAISSIAINILFLLSSLPYFLLSMINDYSDAFINLIDLFEFLISISFFILYLNLNSTFLINKFFNSMFQIELRSSFLNRNISMNNSNSRATV